MLAARDPTPSCCLSEGGRSPACPSPEAPATPPAGDGGARTSDSSSPPAAAWSSPLHAQPEEPQERVRLQEQGHEQGDEQAHEPGQGQVLEDEDDPCILIDTTRIRHSLLFPPSDCESSSASSAEVSRAGNAPRGAAPGLTPRSNLSTPPSASTPSSGAGSAPSFSRPGSFSQLRKTLCRLLSFGDLNLARDAAHWGPLPGYEHLELKMGQLQGRQVEVAVGRLGQVYRGQLGEREVALKVVRHAPSASEAEEASPEFQTRLAAVRRELLREVDSLSKLHHPRIVQFIGVAERPVKKGAHMWCIAMEFMAGGSLCDAIKRRRGEPFSLPLLLSLATDVAEAVDYLHSLGYIHRDLKTPNVLLDASGTAAKVADFGTSRLNVAGAQMTAETGTFRWMAPEMIRGEQYTEKVDVFSFGVILWELLTLGFPWPDQSCVQVAFAVAQKGERPAFAGSHPACLVQLAEQCWAEDPSERPSFRCIAANLRNAQNALTTDPSLGSFELLLWDSDSPSKPLGSKGKSRPREWSRWSPASPGWKLPSQRRRSLSESCPSDETEKGRRRDKVMSTLRSGVRKAKSIIGNTGAQALPSTGTGVRSPQLHARPAC